MLLSCTFLWTCWNWSWDLFSQVLMSEQEVDVIAIISHWTGKVTLGFDGYRWYQSTPAAISNSLTTWLVLLFHCKQLSPGWRVTAPTSSSSSRWCLFTNSIRETHTVLAHYKTLPLVTVCSYSPLHPLNKETPPTKPDNVGSFCSWISHTSNSFVHLSSHFPSGWSVSISRSFCWHS